MTTLRILLLSLFLSLLAACGGGGSDQKPIAAVLGDSVSAGTFTQPDGSTGFDNPLPIQTIRAVGNFDALDLAIPGLVAAEAISGGFTWTTFGPNQPLAEVLKTTPAQTIMFRFGTADALRGIGPDLFRSNLHELVRLTRAAGKAPVLIEPIRQPPATAARADALRDVVLEVAQVDGVPLIPVRDLPWHLIDDVHPDQPTANLYARRIGEYRP